MVLLIIYKDTQPFPTDCPWTPRYQSKGTLCLFDCFLSPCGLLSFIVQLLNHVQLSGTPWTSAPQASLSFSIS